MKFLMRKGGQYEIYVDDMFYGEIIKCKRPMTRWGHRNEFWVLRRYMETFEEKFRYKSLKTLLLTEFHVGFTNHPGPNKILEKIYG